MKFYTGKKLFYLLSMAYDKEILAIDILYKGEVINNKELKFRNSKYSVKLDLVLYTEDNGIEYIKKQKVRLRGNEDVELYGYVSIRYPIAYLRAIFSNSGTYKSMVFASPYRSAYLQTRSMGRTISASTISSITGKYYHNSKSRSVISIIGFISGYLRKFDIPAMDSMNYLEYEKYINNQDSVLSNKFIDKRVKRK